MNELQAFEKHLRENEKSPAAIEKYLRDAHAFLFFAFGRRKGSKMKGYHFHYCFLLSENIEGLFTVKNKDLIPFILAKDTIG